MKILTVSLVIAVFLVALLMVSGMKGPDLSHYEHLIEPRITSMEDQKVLVVEAAGNPENIREKAFLLLFKYYINIKGVPRGRNQPAPRARWPQRPGSMKTEWKGLYAMPVPEQVTDLPEYQLNEIKIGASTWEYGEVAEILHIGPYTEEGPTVERLRQFVKDRGYVIVGGHEEEYLRSSVMFFETDPDDFYTIIRYRVRKAAEVTPES
jgi:effector-binding domain-containing protein